MAIEGQVVSLPEAAHIQLIRLCVCVCARAHLGVCHACVAHKKSACKQMHFMRRPSMHQEKLAQLSDGGAVHAGNCKLRGSFW